MRVATNNHNVTIREFTVAPNINPKDGLPCHEWYVEFETQPEDIKTFSKTLYDPFPIINANNTPIAIGVKLSL